MSYTGSAGSLAGVLAAAHALVDELQRVEVTRESDDAVLDGLRELERLTRRLDSAGYGLINDSQRRGQPDAHGCRSMGRFLRHLLRIGKQDAGARAAAAEAAGPRAGLSGEALEPVFAHVAAAQAAGVVSQRHARLIEQTIDALPDAVQAEHAEQAERDLVGYATSFGPEQLAQLARRITAWLNPDGVLDEPDAVAAKRGFTLDARADGSSAARGVLSPELTERLKTFFDVYAAPKPAMDSIRDSRTVAQRQHDALLDVCEQAVRCEQVPTNNGVSATIVVTMSAEQYLSGAGLARTGHGATVRADEAKAWSGGDAEVLAVVLNSVREVTHYSHTHRIVTEAQRRVIAARDGGCTFPGCPEPPGRCQVDHLLRYEHGGRTTVGNGTLECRYHHREAHRLGYQPTMIDSVPYWIPPPWIDAARTPQRNTLHDTVPAA